MKLSTQALTTFVMILQKALMEQTDITELMKELDFDNTVDGLVCVNAPVLDYSNVEFKED